MNIQIILIQSIVAVWKIIDVWGQTCRFYPSCSQYAVSCAKKYPPHKAIPKIIWRLLRCNPFFSKGGVDLP